MKKRIFIMMLIIISKALSGPRIIPPLAQSEEGKLKYTEVSQLSAAGNLRGLMDTLPELELLWPEDPKGYFHAMAVNLPPLLGSMEPDASKIALAALPRIIEKKCPENTEIALVYFSLKSQIISNYGDVEVLRTNPAYYLIIVDFLNEIRSKSILNYRAQYVEHTRQEILKNDGVKNVDALSTKALQEKVEKILAQDKKNDDMDRLQKSLSDLDKSIVDSLIACAPSVALQGAEKKNSIVNFPIAQN